MFQDAKDNQTHFSVGKQIGDLTPHAIGDIKYRQLCDVAFETVILFLRWSHLTV